MTTSYEILRRAAALMRERATKAEASGDGEPWYHADEVHAPIGGGSWNTADAEHIASWHPDVALAVADMLEDAADSLDLRTPTGAAVLTVARAYLREQARVE